MYEFIAPLNILVIGMVALWWFSDLVVRYAQQLAYLTKYTTFFLGFVLIAFSTGMPELSIAISSVFAGAPALSVGDILGSNFANIAVVLGLPVLSSRAIGVSKHEIRPFMTMLGLVALLTVMVFLFKNITWKHGLFLIATYASATWWLTGTRHAQELVADELAEAKEEVKLEEEYLISRSGTILKLVGSMLLVVIASSICVRAALRLINLWNLQHEIFGATVMALGTSLPELAVNFLSVRKREYSLAIGNALGSSLMQGSFVLGLLACMAGKVSLAGILHLLPFSLGAFAIVGFGIGVRGKINRLEGLLLVALYIGFLYYEYFFKLMA